MPFTRKKFLGLSGAGRAKKLADLLDRIIRGAERDRATLIQEYNELTAWEGAPERSVNSADPRAWPGLYLHWREAAGLGAEREVLSALSASWGQADRKEPAGNRIDYDVWLHDIRSGHNVGSVLRTVDAMGLRGVHRSGYTPGPDQSSVRSAAMGCEAWIDCREHVSAANFFRWLEKAGEREREAGRPRPQLVALETDPRAVNLAEFVWPASGVIVPGNEELGVAPDILERCDFIVRIPLYGRKASMNLANAFAIAAYALRQGNA